jgi:hypothetical protein
MLLGNAKTDGYDNYSDPHKLLDVHQQHFLGRPFLKPLLDKPTIDWLKVKRTPPQNISLHRHLASKIIFERHCIPTRIVMV